MHRKMTDALAILKAFTRNQKLNSIHYFSSTKLRMPEHLE